MAKKDKKVKKEKAIQSYEVSRPVSLFDEFEKALFERRLPFGPVGWPWRGDWPWRGEFAPFEGRIPAVDIVDREKDVLVRAEIPGVSKEDLEVTVADDLVTIRGQSKREEEEEKEGEYFRRETSYGEFSRTVRLPAKVDAENTKAKFKDGVLEMTLRKLESTKRHGVTIE